MTGSVAATHLLLDANVLLHFVPPDQVDWPVLCGATEVVPVIYPLLRSELSKAKDLHPNKAIRRRAAEREAWLRDRLRRPSDPIRPGVWLHRDVDEARGLIAGLDLNPQLKDDLIVVLALRLRGEDRDVRVVTADGGLEMKLEDRGVPVIVPDDLLRLQPEPDPERLRAEKAEKELRAQRDRLPGLVVSWRRSAPLVRQAELGDIDGYVEAALLQAEKIYCERQVTRRYQPEDSIFDHRHRSDRAMMVAFLRQQHAWLSRAAGAVKFGLTVENGGTLAASNVRVRVHTPAGVVVYSPGGLGPKPTRGPWVMEVFSGVPVHSAGMDIDVDAAPHTVVDGHPAVSANHRSAEFSWPRIQQLSGATSVDFWMVATTTAELGTSSVRLEIICDEVRGAAAGALSILLSG